MFAIAVDEVFDIVQIIYILDLFQVLLFDNDIRLYFYYNLLAERGGLFRSRWLSCILIIFYYLFDDFRNKNFAFK